MRKLISLLLSAALGAALPASAAPPPEADASENVKFVGNTPLGGANDVVFTDDGYAVVGTNGSGEQAGLWIVDVRNPRKPKPVGHLPCAGSGYDVGLWNDIAVMSIDSASGNSSTSESGCNVDGTENTEGIRLVDISNRARPREVKFVETPCGSHTNITFDHNGRGLVYVQSYPASTSGACPSAHGIISVVDITNPAKAEIVSSPSVVPAVGCHDGAIAGDLAYMACLTEGQVWDISDPLEPEILSHLHDVAGCDLALCRHEQRREHRDLRLRVVRCGQHRLQRFGPGPSRRSLLLRRERPGGARPARLFRSTPTDPGALHRT